MVAELRRIEGLGPGEISLTLSPLSMPSLTFLDLGFICFFEESPQFMILDSLANAKCSSMKIDISVPDDDLGVHR